MKDDSTCVERKMSVCPWHHLNREWDRREKPSTSATEGTSPSTQGRCPEEAVCPVPSPRSQERLWSHGLLHSLDEFPFGFYSPYSISKEPCLVSKILKNQNLLVCCFLLIKKQMSLNSKNHRT